MIKKFQIVVFVILLATLASGCTTVSKRSTAVQGKLTLKDICAQNGIYWQWDPVSQIATMEYEGTKAQVLVGSNLVIVDKDRITLSAPVRMVRSVVLVPSDFQSKVVSRLRGQVVEAKQYGTSYIREIVIDAGHGGKDPGAVGRGSIEEKTIVLDISKRLKKILQGRGFKIKMTRESDQFISLQKRTEIASQSGADLFISIHANSSPARSVQGLEVFTSKHLGLTERVKEQRKTNQRLMFKNLSIKKGSKDIENIVSDMLYTHKQGEANDLARQLTKKTARMIKTKNRGSKQSRFYVLRNTLIPAILIEVGFLTNPREAKLLQTGTYQEKIARGIADSIVEYANAQ